MEAARSASGRERNEGRTRERSRFLRTSANQADFQPTIRPRNAADPAQPRRNSLVNPARRPSHFHGLVSRCSLRATACRGENYIDEEFNDGTDEMESWIVPNGRRKKNFSRMTRGDWCGRGAHNAILRKVANPSGLRLVSRCFWKCNQLSVTGNIELLQYCN